MIRARGSHEGSDRVSDWLGRSADAFLHQSSNHEQENELF